MRELDGVWSSSLCIFEASSDCMMAMTVSAVPPGLSGGRHRNLRQIFPTSPRLYSLSSDSVCISKKAGAESQWIYSL